MITLRAGTALGVLAIATAQANAGALAIREQSPYGQGTSFAGVAAGGALSSMFWNPAVMTQFQGIVTESAVSGIFSYASHTPHPGTTPVDLGALGYPGASNSLPAALVPGSYYSYQLNPNLWLGLSINAPFGLSVNLPDRWAGRDYGTGAGNLKSYNATPSIAYRINDWISVGAGVQIQYASLVFQQGIGATPGDNAVIKANGWGYGFTAGVTLTPTPTTMVGIGWRSRIDQDFEGTLALSTFHPFTTTGSVNTTVKAPDIVSLGIRQRIDANWTVMGTVEWSNWSRIGTSVWTVPNGSAATVLTSPVKFPFQYDDGWFFSVGTEYRWSDRLQLRAGVGYELSPISDSVRMPVIPDNDRLWASVGATWQLFRGIHFDLAYTHIWVKDAPVNISAASGNPWFNGVVNYNGTVNGHADIISGALVVPFAALEPAPASKNLITK
jgi:long-chain fatty acid transport protein